ncbi:ABC transporter permease subunit [Actinomyces ruminis]|uniref:ABC transporter permease subunit n=1 Tax=Actinomyces ruminis TaxID=1937003 RepID=UPI00211F1E95|nr:ABC transporter permease subunit [Actinomyces ruminis]
MPTDLEEAAALDGASAWITFVKIMWPLARPGVLSAAMLTLMGLWNETLLALVFITDDKKYTLPQSLLALQGTMQYTSDWGDYSPESSSSSFPPSYSMPFLANG